LCLLLLLQVFLGFLYIIIKAHDLSVKVFDVSIEHFDFLVRFCYYINFVVRLLLAETSVLVVGGGLGYTLGLNLRTELR